MSIDELKIKQEDKEPAPLEEAVDKIVTPVKKFTENQAASGIILLVATIAALVIANSDYQVFYHSLNQMKFGITLDEWSISHSIKHWVNDALLVLFFFLLGMEIKKELLVGDLKDLSQSALVLIIAIGGMVFPALFYIFATAGDESFIKGWGIPMATDTAFALGLLALLGSRVPGVAAVILSALAIVDDIGAVLVINLFYSESLAVMPLLWAALTVLAMVFLNLLGVRKALPYFLFGLVLWFFILSSGVHATTAGILAAFCIPTKPQVKTHWFSRQMRRLLNKFEKIDDSEKNILEQEKQHEIIEAAQDSALAATTPIQHWTWRLEPAVYFFIIPVFAFLNAGVTLPDNISSMELSPVWMGIFLGLFIGKPIGITLLAWLSVKFNIARLPKDISLLQFVGLGWLAGIGFTMSLFISTLAFDGAPLLLKQAKLGVLTGSLASAVCASVLLVMVAKRQSKTR